MGFCYKTITKIIGQVVFIAGLSMLLPMITAVVYDEKACTHAFLHVLLACLVTGAIISRVVPSSAHRMRLRDGFLTVSMTWLFISAIAALPLVISGAIPNYIDAFFEMCSGFSTTGASVVADVEALPKSILMWRSFSHWLGGMGILLFAIAWMPALGISGQEVVEAETPGPTLSKLTPKMSDTAKDLYFFYLLLTVAETVLLLPSGIGFFDALTHTFSTVGTGGFGNYNDSIAHFGNFYVECVIMVFMLIAGTNFNLMFVLIRRTRAHRKMLKDDELTAYLRFFFITALVITFWNAAKGPFDGFFPSMRHAFFQTASILTTTGFSTCDFALWPALSCLSLFVLFFVGGCSSSTAGGPKVIRVLVMLRMVMRSIAIKLHPNAYIRIKYNEKKLSIDTVQGICAYVFLFLFSFFAVSLVVSLDNYDLFTSMSAAASCLSNIGPAFGAAGPASNYGIFSDGVKFILSLAMIAGRLELFTILMLFSGKFWNRYE